LGIGRVFDDINLSGLSPDMAIRLAKAFGGGA